MRSIRLHMTIQGQPSAAVYTTLADLGRDLDCRPQASHFVVSGSADAEMVSGWESNFRSGVLRWFKEEGIAEESRDGNGGPIPFQPLTSDVALFEGSWSCVDDGTDTAVTFAARLDMGIPSPADQVQTHAVATEAHTTDAHTTDAHTTASSDARATETRAVRALIDDAMVILTCLFEGNLRLDDVVIQAHEAAALQAAC